MYRMLSIKSFKNLQFFYPDEQNSLLIERKNQSTYRHFGNNLLQKVVLGVKKIPILENPAVTLVD